MECPSCKTRRRRGQRERNAAARCIIMSEMTEMNVCQKARARRRWFL